MHFVPEAVQYTLARSYVTSISLRDRHSIWFADLTSLAVSLALRMLDVHTDNSLFDAIKFMALIRRWLRRYRTSIGDAESVKEPIPIHIISFQCS